MATTLIPATPVRGHVEIWYDAAVLTPQDATSKLGDTLALVDKSGTSIVQIPRFVADTMFATDNGIPREDVVHGHTKDMVQFTVYLRREGAGRAVIAMATFHSPFADPIEDERFALNVQKGRGLQ